MATKQGSSKYGWRESVLNLISRKDLNLFTKFTKPASMTEARNSTKLILSSILETVSRWNPCKFRNKQIKYTKYRFHRIIRSSNKTYKCRFYRTDQFFTLYGIDKQKFLSGAQGIEFIEFGNCRIDCRINCRIIAISISTYKSLSIDFDVTIPRENCKTLKPWRFFPDSRDACIEKKGIMYSKCLPRKNCRNIRKT